MRRRNLPIYRKVQLLFLLLILPIYLMSAVFIVSGAVYISRNRELAVRSQINLIGNQLHDEFEKIRWQQTHLMNNGTVLDLNFLSGVISGYDDVVKIQFIEDTLFLIANSSPMIHDVNVYLLEARISLSVKEGFHRLDDTGLQELTHLGRREGAVSNGKGGFVNIRSFPSSLSPNVPDPAYVSAIELSKDGIDKMLREFYRESGAAVSLVGTEGELFYKGGEDRDGEERRERFEEKLEPFEITLIVDMPPGDGLRRFQWYSIFIFLFICLSVIVIILFSIMINRMIHRPLKQFVSVFNRVERDDFEIIAEGEGQSEFAYLYESFRKFVYRYKTSTEDLYRKEIALKQAEFKHLQSQINPHFLYNSFFIVSKLCREEDMERAGSLTSKLGNYFKYITRSNEFDITLEQEIAHIRGYTEIQSIRFGNRIRVDIADPEESFRTFRIPRIILQPVIENAYEHAFNNTLEGGIITISYRKVDPFLHIVIEDNGDGFANPEELTRALREPEKAGVKTALVNISERLQLMFGVECGVRAENSIPQGARITLITKGKEVNVTIVSQESDIV